jgi:endoglucanase
MSAVLVVGALLSIGGMQAQAQTPAATQSARPPAAPQPPAAQQPSAAQQPPEAPPAPKPEAKLALDSRSLPLGGTLRAPAAWQAYKSHFITNEGRVVDTGNNDISHSEGQGYAMLLAVAANDRTMFERLWGWTRANLMVRDDELIAWRWEPRKRPGVADMNNASDGDILVAWALAEAAELWSDLSYRTAGRRIAVEVARKVVLFKTKVGAILLPAVAGFHSDDRPDGPIVNLSYYVFPAFARLPLVAPEVDWAGLTQTGLDLLDMTRTTPEALPPDWMSLKDWKYAPAQGFPPQFSYNAVRVPLYLAWAGIGEREQYAPFMSLVARTRGALSIVDVSTGKNVSSFGETGIGAIGALTACVVEGAKAPSLMLASHADENYYPATLHMLALVAMQMRYPSCLRN